MTGPEICQSRLWVAPWTDPMSARLPGLQPVAPGDWLRSDDAFAAQMAYREHLMEERFEEVVALGGSAAAEVVLLQAVIEAIKEIPGYRPRDADTIIRPDGAEVNIMGQRPLVTAARLVQEDMLILEEIEGRYVLTCGVLCFPASWTLGQKVGRGMLGIHQPVDRYDDNLGKRVDRVVAALQPGKAVWRANVLCYNDPELFQPRLEHARRPFDRNKPVWVRVERQSLMRLSPETVVFTIHTHVVPLSRLTRDQAAGLPEAVRNGGSMGETN